MARRRTTARPPLHDRLHALARDLVWTWTPPLRDLLESVDPELWMATGHNPVRVLDEIDPARWEALAADRDLERRVRDAERLRDRLHRGRTWYATRKPAPRSMLVAYLCMEYGIHECLPLYSGGLGILAGDHLKSASDLGIPLVAVGVLWREGYYRQEIDAAGAVRVLYLAHPPATLPIEDTGVSTVVAVGRSTCHLRIWRAQVGRVPLYLLDSDVDDNSPALRDLTRRLYSGDADHRIRQEIVLGIGGLHALDALGLAPTVFHLNEGHAAFCGLERLARLVEDGIALDEATETVRASTVFTTHTPVPAGNDRFDPKHLGRYIGGYAKRLGVSRQRLLALGREDESDRDETFCMTVLALKLAAHCNGVSELHGAVSRDMWTGVYDAASPDEVPIGHVTNGVHTASWISDEARGLFDRHLELESRMPSPDAPWWREARRIPINELWELRQRLRRRMITSLRERLRRQIVAQGGGSAEIEPLYEVLDEDALTIGFARRFATYKRAPLVFRDVGRLARILQDADRPVQLVFAGKAHPRDADGNAFIQQVIEMTRHPKLVGRVWLCQNYDQSIGRLLTSGCDLWLNNPIKPMEASGTSGMKPPLNGGLNLSVLDGWWPESFDGTNGWAITGGDEQRTPAKRDAADAESIYQQLEGEIVPLFYDRNRRGVPTGWVRRMRASIATVAPAFSAHRMLGDYVERAYAPAHG